MIARVHDSTERELRRLAWRYSAAARTTVAVLSGLLGIAAAPAAGKLVTVAVVAVVLLWSVPYTVRLSRGPVTWLVCVDLAVILLACLTQRWTVSPDAIGNAQGWVLGFASLSVVACQWHTSVPVGALTTVLVDAGFLAGAWLAAPQQWTAALVMAAWLPVEAALSRTLWILVWRAGQRADALVTRVERDRGQIAVQQARRAEELAYTATLHDTAASTLLMVGLGEVGAGRGWLREQARRDLTAMDGRVDTARGTATVDLTRRLREVTAASQVRVDEIMPARLPVRTRVAAALCGCVREALTNVARHSGTTAASVSANLVYGQVVVLVADCGRGFALDAVPLSRRGVTESIIGRMHAIGGRAEIVSAPGRGTTVRLEWPCWTA